MDMNNMTDDLISRKAAITKITNLLYLQYGYEGMEDDVREIFENLPAVDAEPVRRGGCRYCSKEWGICNPVTNRFTIPPHGRINFCPICGAKIEVRNENN